MRLAYRRQGKDDTLTVKLGTREHQLDLNLPAVAPSAQQEIAPAERTAGDELLSQIRQLRAEIAALQKQIDRLRKELKTPQK